MKHLCILLLILSSITVRSQGQNWDFEQPDYSEIEKNIINENSNLFYKTLMKKFKASDTTMTIKEKRHLYYGYSFQEGYSPYSRSDYSDSLRGILRKNKLSEPDYAKIITFGDSILMANPFDLRTLNHQLFALEQTGNQALFSQKVVQMQIIIEALLSSGNGTTKDNAFYVIYTTHEYDLLDILGFAFGGTQSLIEHYDYLTLAENEANLEGLYFDVSPCLNSMSKLFKK